MRVARRRSWRGTTAGRERIARPRQKPRSRVLRPARGRKRSRRRARVWLASTPRSPRSNTIAPKRLIRAPSAGIVTSRLVEPGELVAAGAPLAVVIDLDRRLGQRLCRRAARARAANRAGRCGHRDRCRRPARRTDRVHRAARRVHAAQRPDGERAREARLSREGRRRQPRGRPQAGHAGRGRTPGGRRSDGMSAAVRRRPASRKRFDTTLALDGLSPHRRTRRACSA